VSAVLAIPSVSQAATPCWKAVITDWSKDNAVNGRYSTACIRTAMVQAPTDLKIYSSLEDDLQTALQKRSARRLAGGAHVTPASLATTGQASSGSFLVALLSGLAALVLACAGVAAVLRHRRTHR
jgi:hypothetical protein